MYPSVGCGSSAADRGHGAGGLDEVGVVDAVAGPFAPHRRADQRTELFIRRAVAHRGSEVCLFGGEEAGADVALGGDPQAVARVAERLGDGADDADAAGRAVGEAVAGGWLVI